MDAPVPIPKTIKSFMDRFVTKKNDIPPVCGKPTFTLCKPLMDDIDKNLIYIENDSNPICKKTIPRLRHKSTSEWTGTTSSGVY